MASFDFRNQRVLVIGDVILDKYVHGNVDRISPEAPVPVLLKKSDDISLGGAANVALNLLRLKANPFLIGVIGDDHNGNVLKDFLQKNGLEKIYLIKDKSRPTTTKTRIISQGQQLLRVDQESTKDISVEIEDDIFSTIKTLIQTIEIDSIILQDYNKGLFTHRLIRGIIDFASLKGIPTIVDPKIKNFYSYKGATIIKPNLREVSAAIGKDLSGQEVIKTIDIEKLRSSLDCKCLFTTLGSEGILITTEKSKEHIPTGSRTIRDVCGAGDTVLAVLAAGIGARLPYNQIAKLANIAGGQVCEKIGVVPLDYVELVKESRILANKANK